MDEQDFEQLALIDLSHCPMVHPAMNKVDYDVSSFCGQCPDACKIPSGCKLDCGWPENVSARGCPLTGQCPCAQPCNDERAAKMESWALGNQERSKLIRDLFGKQAEWGKDNERPKEPTQSDCGLFKNVLICG